MHIWDYVAFQPKVATEDQYIWTAKASGKFSIDSAWHIVRKKKQDYPHHGLIWYQGNVPRYSLTVWLASMGRLSTMDRPHMRGAGESNRCPLCDEEVESHDHLFFSCNYSSTVWQSVKQQAQIHWPSIRWNALLQWASNQFRSKKNVINLLSRHMLSSTVYFIWTERNNRIFQRHYKPPAMLSREVLSQVRLLLMNFHGDIPSSMCMRWNI